MSNSSHKSKSYNGIRGFLSFILFVLLVFSSLSICGRQEVTNSSEIVKRFTSYNYVSELRQDVIDYAGDCFAKNGIDNQNVENAITYDLIETAIKGYINYELQSKLGYSQDAEISAVEQIKNNLNDEIVEQLDSNGVKYKNDTVNAVCEQISSYAQEEIEIKGIEYIKTITNVGPVVFTVMSIVSVICAAIIMLILFFVGETRYRSIREISVSFLSAGILDFILSAIVLIILKIKHLDIYPLYLQNALMEHIHNAIIAVSMAGGVMIILSAFISTLVWKLKRKEL